MLEDPDTAVRALGVRLLPLVTLLPEDPHAIDEVRSLLSHPHTTPRPPRPPPPHPTPQGASEDPLQLVKA